ncbi:MAG TPA: ribosome maturation factor RimM [Candidatus Rifleibacterium sp.]|nr:ribosome maturation factor RimM [Candidatus Rifleibacterium sp.]HPT45507.1 ribosome maturation factor RimM [Candidatus Rifleibacterium sp.]
MSQKPKPEVVRLKQADSAEKAEDAWIIIGEVRKTVGLQGWLRVGLLTDYPERFKPGARVYVQNRQGEREPAVVCEWRGHFTGTAIDVKFEGADDCDAAAAYVNSSLVIPKSDREPLRSNSEFYPDELVGMQVIGPDGQPSGQVIKLEAEAPCPYILVQTAASLEVMIPFKKIFIKSVDRAAGTVRLVEPVSFHIPEE